MTAHTPATTYRATLASLDELGGWLLESAKTARDTREAELIRLASLRACLDKALRGMGTVQPPRGPLDTAPDSG